MWTCCEIVPLMDNEITQDCMRMHQSSKIKTTEYYDIFFCSFNEMGFIDDNGVMYPENIRVYLEQKFANESSVLTAMKHAIIDDCIPMVDEYKLSIRKTVAVEDLSALLFSCAMLRFNVRCPEQCRNDEGRK
uniref:Uncharacterized protein n=1 Tax=Anopheles farauti TaxID=69004 RepID=A0A182QBH5_9DIPT